jgi:hypothetical protein
VIALLFFLLVVAPGIYFYFTSPGMGYTPAMAGGIAGAVAVIALVLLPFAWKGKL